MKITEAHIDEALRIARAGGRDGRTYDQGTWCGTSCCVLGWARIAAGIPEENCGPRPDEIEDTPRARTLTALMHSGDPAVLTLMEAVKADGSLDLTALPKGLSVSGGLDLSGCVGLTALPEGLSVGGELNLSGCVGLSALPEGLSVGRGLDLSGCVGLTALPEGLSVGGELDLSGCTGLGVDGY